MVETTKTWLGQQQIFVDWKTTIYKHKKNCCFWFGYTRGKLNFNKLVTHAQYLLNRTKGFAGSIVLFIAIYCPVGRSSEQMNRTKRESVLNAQFNGVFMEKFLLYAFTLRLSSGLIIKFCMFQPFTTIKLMKIYLNIILNNNSQR